MTEKENVLDEGVKSSDDKVPKIDMEKKMNYIENVAIGTIVAFKLPNGKVKSAMVMAKAPLRRKLKLETEYGKVFKIDYKDVVWVKTGNRFPKGVYEALKGIKGKGAHRNVEETEEA